MHVIFYFVPGVVNPCANLPYRAKKRFAYLISSLGGNSTPRDKRRDSYETQKVGEGENLLERNSGSLNPIRDAIISCTLEKTIERSLQFLALQLHDRHRLVKACPRNSSSLTKRNDEIKE